MNKRARNRLVVVTLVLIGVMAGILVFQGQTGTVYSRTVLELLSNPELDGQRVKVSGTVVDGSWDGINNPMKFLIRDTESETSETVLVSYSGAIPSTFGDGIEVLVTGEYRNGTITTEEMITKCPSKYESSE